MLEFRKLYNPKPLVYADFAHEQSGNKLEQIAEHNKFKEESDLASPTTDWSEDFVFEVPNLSSIGSAPTQIAWVMKLMNIRLEKPTTVSLPNTVLEKDTFLDNVFGPVNYLPDFAESGTTQWISGLGKRYINGEGKTGIKGIYSIGIGYSPTVGTVEGDVVFFADLLDEHLNLPSIQERKFNVPTYSGSSLESNFTNYIYQNETKVKGLEFLKQELRGSTFNVLEQKPTNGESTVGTNLYLQMTKTEYDTLSTTGLSMDVQEPMIKFNGINNDTDLDAVPYRRAPIEVNGIDNSGNSFKVNGGFDVLTFNYDTLSTESKSDTANVSEQGNGILTIDEFIDALKVVEEIYHTDNLLETIARLRIHYYGSSSNLPMNNRIARFLDLSRSYNKLVGAIFDLSVPESPDRETYDWINKNNTVLSIPREMNQFVFPRDKRFIYHRLTSHANENGAKDNPSPYLIQGNNKIDLGQILYGFESIYYQPHYPPSAIFQPPSTTYSAGYESYPVRIVNDLAGWPANVVTPVAELYNHLLDGESPYGTNGAPNASLQEYYEISAPQADLFGNADAIGIFKAIQVLNENPQNTDIKLSDAFTLYYKGESALRSSITLPLSPSTSLYESIHRWKIFSIYFGFMEETSPGIYSWVPDNASKWSDVKTPYDPISNPNGKNYSERLLRFTEFWNNRRQETFYTSINLLMESSIFSPVRFSSTGNFANTGKTELQWVKDEIDNAFESIFLVDLKQKSI